MYRLDVDTDFEPVSGSVRISNRGTDEAGPNFVLGQVVANGLLGGETNLGVLFGAATDYDEYHGLGLLANVGVGRGRRPHGVLGLPVAFGSARARRRSRRLLLARSRDRGVRASDSEASSARR